MGILNVTPDSFSDGNQFIGLSQAIERAKVMIAEGVDIIDVGGESTRPSALPVTVDEELQRVIPIVKEIRKYSTIPISIDTRKAEVAHQGILNGANIVNDVSALRHDQDMIKVLKTYPDSLIVLMHMQGQPNNMQDNPTYFDVLEEVYSFMKERIEFCKNEGIGKNRILIDPGIGFGKNLSHNLMIINNLIRFKDLDVPIVLGASRKSFISEIDKSEPDDRLGGSMAAASVAIDANVQILRVHDVKEHKQFVKVKRAIRGER